MFAVRERDEKKSIDERCRARVSKQASKIRRKKIHINLVDKRYNLISNEYAEKINPVC